MKTIEERAEEACIAWSYGELDHDLLESCFVDGFFAGAKSEREELLRWRDPKEELPDREQYDWVLIRIRGCDGFIGLPHIGELRSDGYWHSKDYDDLFKLGESFEERLNCKVIGWRPIIELPEDGEKIE